MSGYFFAIVSCVALVLVLIILLRTRHLREKYAMTWIAVALGVCILGAFPGLVETIASAVGVETPSNLIFALALIVLLGVCIQLSVEITELEEETRTLAEALALVRFDVEELRAERVGGVPDKGSDGPPAGGPGTSGRAGIAGDDR